MDPIKDWEASLGRQELEALKRLDSPAAIQAFLDEMPYSAEEVYRSPRSVLRDRQAHCFDGALFAAAALRRLGHPPLIVNMFAERDDEHLIAIFKRDGTCGAVGKSNFVGLRFREPVYRSLRELVMSYFEVYYNLERVKSLRSYTRPLNLRTFDRLNWMVSDAHLDAIAQHLDELHRILVLKDGMITELSPVDERSYQAGMLGVNEAGLYKLS